jgi:predicted DNA-binding protein (MmcQ/YjbR family)
MTRNHPHLAGVRQLRAFGLAYPGAHIKSPWPNHMDLAVNDKTFAYLSLDGEPLHISCKLPHSSVLALALPFTTPTEYGLGRSGWVTANFDEKDPLPLALLEEWIDESYRAQAPKRLQAQLATPPKAASPGRATKAKPAKAKARPAKAKPNTTKARPKARAPAVRKRTKR